MAGHRATWAEVDLGRIASNFAALRALAGREAAVFPVVKANAYGHGAGPVAKRLETEGVAALCVAIPEEGLELRRCGIGAPILCMGAVEPQQIAPAARQRITLTIYEPGQIEAFEASSRSAGIPVHFHLKVDTGMNRLGIAPEEIGPFLDRLRASRGMVLSGVFSNLASADRPEDPSSAAQGERLLEAAAAIKAAGHDPRPVHLANSAGLLYHPALRFDAVRPGLLLYGVRPGPGDSGPGFEPALSRKTRALRVRSVPEGAKVGYAATWTAPRPSRLATLAIGYDDGLPRSLSGRGEVLIGERRARLIGAISMDLSVADVTDCGEVEPGDEAVIIGAQGEEKVGAAELAERAGTIPWEIFCGFGRRVPRVLLSGHEVVAVATPLPAVKDVEMGRDPALGAAKAKRPVHEAPKPSVEEATGSTEEA